MAAKQPTLSSQDKGSQVKPSTLCASFEDSHAAIVKLGSRSDDPTGDRNW